MLKAEGLHKTLGRKAAQVHALRGVSLRLQEAEAVGIVGPSGSGKSTLARILTGYLAADAGSVHLGDIPLTVSWARLAPDPQAHPAGDAGPVGRPVPAADGGRAGPRAARRGGLIRRP